MRLAQLWKLLALFFIALFPSCATLRTYHSISFQQPPCIIPIKGFLYETCAPITVSIDGEQLTVPANFNTDLASIPRIFWNILPPQQANFVGPAILHDYMYTNSDGGRAYADDVLYWSLREQGAMWITANVIWLGVRIGGAKHYGPNDHDD